jgi:hypothetical protein
MTLLGALRAATSPSLPYPNGGAWHFCDMGEHATKRQVGMVLTHELILRSRPADLFGCGRRSGIRLRFRGNSRYVIFHATLFNIRIFSHTLFHHCFSISSPFILAILLNFLRALSVCFERWGDGSRGGTRRFWLGSLRKCCEMQDCYPSKRATNRTKMLFHLSTPVGIAFIAKGFSKRVAVPAAIPLVTAHKPTRIFCDCSS